MTATMSSRSASLAAALFVALASPAFAQLGTGQWSQTFPAIGFDAGIRAALPFSDGAGNYLYVGGTFDRVANIGAPGLARWDGFEWQAIPNPSLTPNTSQPVPACIVRYDPDGAGPLPAVAAFAFDRTRSNGNEGGIALWDGAAWSRIRWGNQYQTSWALAFDDGAGEKLYGFNAATSAYERWNGTSWEALPNPGTTEMTGGGNAVVFDDGTGPALFVIGSRASGSSHIESFYRWRPATGWVRRLQISGEIPFDLTPWNSPSGAVIAMVRSSGPQRGVFGFNGTTLTQVGTNLVHGGTGQTYDARNVFTDPANNLYVSGTVREGGNDVGFISRLVGTTWTRLTEFNGTGRDIVAFDDGATARTILIGDFTMPDRSMALQTPTAWTTLSNDVRPGHVDRLVGFSATGSSELFALGDFTLAAGGSVSAPKIARWDGAAWSRVPSATAMNGFSDLARWDDGSGEALYAAAIPTAPAVSRLMRYTGTDWQAQGGFADGQIYSVCPFDDGSGSKLYVGGPFTTLGGVSYKGVARWNGTSFESVGSGFNNAAERLVTLDLGGGPELYAVGRFTATGGLATPSSVASYTGAAWAAPTTANGGGVFDAKRYDSPSGARIAFAREHGVYVWESDGTMSRLGGDFPNSRNAVSMFDDGVNNRLYSGGQPGTYGGNQISGVAVWNGAAWTNAGSCPNGRVEHLAAADLGGGQRLYAGGAFNATLGDPSSGACAWNGVAYSALQGLSGTVNCVAVANRPGGPVLVAGGLFNTSTSGTLLRNVGRWDGSQWVALSSGDGLDGEVFALCAVPAPGGDELFAGGRFAFADGVAVPYIARFNWATSRWEAVGGGVNHYVNVLEWFDEGAGPVLFASGSFTSAAGVPGTASIARWNGAAWSAVGGGMDNRANVFLRTVVGGQPVLLVGGFMTNAGGVPVNKLAVWDGAAWSAPGPASPSTSQVSAIAYGDLGDGAGPSLFINGRVNSNETVLRLSGGTWTSLATRLSSNGAVALSVYDSDGPGGASPVLLCGGGIQTILANSVLTYTGALAQFDGASWSSVGGKQLSDLVTVIHDLPGGAVFVGGRFSAINQITLANFASYDGTAWRAEGNAQVNLVNRMYLVRQGGVDSLYVSGQFTFDASLARWTGSGWQTMLPRGVGLQTDASLFAFDPDGAGSEPESLYLTLLNTPEFLGLLRWNGTAWENTGPSGIRVRRASPVDLDGAGPMAPQLLLLTDNGPLLWDGATTTKVSSTDLLAPKMWTVDLGAGPLAVFGGISSADVLPLDHVARWTGSSWAPVGPGTITASGVTVWSAAVFDDGVGPELYIAGTFVPNGPFTPRTIARLRGGQWEPVGDNAMNYAPELRVADDGSGSKLYAIGNQNFGSGIVQTVKRYSGGAWEAIATQVAGEPLNPSYAQLFSIAAVQEDGVERIYVGGQFSGIDGVPNTNVARWDGVFLEFRLQPRSVTVRHGNPAFVEVRVVGAAPLSHRWYKDDQPLSDDGRISGSHTRKLLISSAAAPGDTGYYECRVTNGYGQVTSEPVLVQVLCPADVNGDEQVDFFDYLDFVAAFDVEDPAADFNRDGIVDFFDYLDFASHFDGEC
jgi:hypothetical protein